MVVTDRRNNTAVISTLQLDDVLASAAVESPLSLLGYVLQPLGKIYCEADAWQLCMKRVGLSDLIVR
jgi:hypothetical protein